MSSTEEKHADLPTAQHPTPQGPGTSSSNSTPTAPPGTSIQVLESFEGMSSPTVETLGLHLFTLNLEQLHRHAQFIANNLSIKQAYIDLVLATRSTGVSEEHDKKCVIAASNAISVLNYGGLSGLFPFQFHEVGDWSGIRVPNANLNFAQVLECNFNNSDLSNCTLVQAVLRGSSFRGANLKAAILKAVGPQPCIPAMQGHTSQVSSVAFSPDGRYFASGSADKSIRIWNVESGQCLATFQGGSLTSEVLAVAFSPNGEWLASGSSDGKTRIWRVASGECAATIHGHAGPITSLCFTSVGDRLASSSRDSTIQIWNTQSWECVSTLQHQDSVNSVRFSLDGKLLASCGEDNTLRIWHAETSECIAMLEEAANVFGVAMSPDGRLIAAGAANGIHLWETEAGERVVSWEGDDPWATSDVCFSPDGRLLAAAWNDCSVWFYDLESKDCIATLQGHTEPVTSLSFSPDGKKLVSASIDGTIRLWDLSKSITRPALRGIFGVSYQQDLSEADFMQAQLDPHLQQLVSPGSPSNASLESDSRVSGANDATGSTLEKSQARKRCTIA